MAKPGRPSPGLDDYLYWQERLASRDASGLSIDDFCAGEEFQRIRSANENWLNVAVTDWIFAEQF